MQSITIYELYCKTTTKGYWPYLGQASHIRNVPIEKIRVNMEFKLSFTSPSIEELASFF